MASAATRGCATSHHGTLEGTTLGASAHEHKRIRSSPTRQVAAGGHFASQSLSSIICAQHIDAGNTSNCRHSSPFGQHSLDVRSRHRTGLHLETKGRARCFEKAMGVRAAEGFGLLLSQHCTVESFGRESCLLRDWTPLGRRSDSNQLRKAYTIQHSGLASKGNSGMYKPGTLAHRTDFRGILCGGLQEPIARPGGEKGSGSRIGLGGRPPTCLVGSRRFRYYNASRRAVRLSALPAAQSSEVTPASPQDPKNPIFEEELSQLLNLLPGNIRTRVEEHPERDRLVEIVLDLGRKPMARFPSGDVYLSEDNVTSDDIELAVSKVGLFGGDNRAGIDRTLHRVSAIRSRNGRIVGLTCRVGRAIPGSAEMVRDLVSTGASILLMGPPGVGKTTAIREVSRMLADEYNKRVVIVDTSNEIGGDGDIPHPGIGRARRMQVPSPEFQHHVMIEAVENHMPQVIVIDEIGTELEAAAAGTIAQRGVQLVGTAHGMTIENLIKNPSLCQLAGGIESVTLGDEEARRRGVQKSVLERKGPPTFSAAVEMISRTEWRVHRSLSATVDAMLLGKKPRCEYRRIDTDGGYGINDRSSTESDSEEQDQETSASYRRRTEQSNGRRYQASVEDDSDSEEEFAEALDRMSAAEQRAKGPGGDRQERSSSSGESRPLLLYPFEVTESALEQVFETLDLDEKVRLTDTIGEADVVLALRAKLKHSSWVRDVAKLRQLPIYAIKANTMPQMVRAVRAILGIDAAATSAAFGVGREDSRAGPGLETPIESLGPPKANVEQEIDALEEARSAVEKIVIPQGLAVELLPRPSDILLLQLNLIEGYQLATDRIGTGKSARLRILPEYIPQTTGGRVSSTVGSFSELASTGGVTVLDTGSSEPSTTSRSIDDASSADLLNRESDGLGGVVSIVVQNDSQRTVVSGSDGTSDVSSQSSTLEVGTSEYTVEEAIAYAKTSKQRDNKYMDGYQSGGRSSRIRREGKEGKFRRTRVLDQDYDDAEYL